MDAARHGFTAGRITSMRVARLLLVLAACVLATTLTSFFARRNDSIAYYGFTVDVAANVGGIAKIYYDIGRGLTEEDSALVHLKPSVEPVALYFPLPEGRYRELRFDPLESGATVVFARARIVASGNATVRSFASRDFLPNDQIAAVTIKGELAEMHPKPGMTDPNLTLQFNPPLVLKYGWKQHLRSVWGSLLVGSLLCFLLVVGAPAAWRNRELLRARALSRPRTALMLLGALGAVAASYPVVFFGKSFVSPNVGPVLLYSTPPHVPGYTDIRTQDVRGADVGAMMWQHLPYSTVQARALLDHGEWPLWNRYNSSGVTLLGQGQSMFGDPIHLFVVLARGASWAWDIKFVLAKALFAAGLALCVWQLTGNFGAAALVALTAAFIGFFNYRVNHPAIFSLCYSPWILHAWLSMIAAENRRRLAAALVLWTVANLTVLGSGTVKEAYLLAISLNATGVLAWCLSPIPAGASRGGRAAAISAVGICGLLITAPLWLTFADALKAAHTAYSAPLAFQIPRAWFIGFFDDLFYRELRDNRFIYVPTGNILFLLGALWTLVQLHRLWRTPGITACFASGVVSLSLAFEIVPAAWIIQVPMLRNVHHLNNTFSAISLVLVIVLAGCGFAAAFSRVKQERPWRPIAAIALICAGLLAIYFHDMPAVWIDGTGFQGWTRRLPSHLFFYSNLLLMIVAGSGLVLLAIRAARRPAGPVTALLAALAIGALVYRHGLHLPVNGGDGYIAAPALRWDLAAPSPAVAQVKTDQAAPFRALGTENDLFAGFSAIYGLEGINGPDAIMNPFYRQLAEAGSFITGTDWHFVFDLNSLPKRRPLLELLGVKYLLSPHAEIGPQSGFEKVGAFDLNVYRNDRAWPRAFFTDQLATYEEASEFIRRLGAESNRPFAAIQSPQGKDNTAIRQVAPDGLDLTKRAASLLNRTFSDRLVQPATNYRLTGNTTRFVIDAPTSGVVVLTETFLAEDFRVTINQQPAPYFRVNHAFKGVFIAQPGRYEISFAYWPRHFTLSLLMSAVGLLGVASIAGGLWRSAPSPLP
jgi:hypothetical protein